jgi:hypothetical protein
MKNSSILAIILALILSCTQVIFSQEVSKAEKKAQRKAKKEEKIKSGKLMVTPLAGPAYTPELGFTIAGGIMTSFKTNPSDSLIQRSSAPIMLGFTSTGAYFIQTKWTTFWLNDKLRIYSDLNYKNMPYNYWDIGYRLTVQPRMNLRLDYGFGRESSGFYFNFNEAF